MNLQKIQEKKSGISPIIATLLLILIAIAAGVIVYAYVIGFIGGSTSNSGGATSVIQITNFCASAANHACNSAADAWYISVLNTGSVAISAGTVQIYFTDITGSSSGSTSCTLGSSVAPGSTYTCTPTPTAIIWNSVLSPSPGDSLSVKIVNPDGGAATSSTKVIG
ncbi:MAG: archaellin/type IV pilin N-terminal domain-containing protein [Nitrososphaerales archaeon]